MSHSGEIVAGSLRRPPWRSAALLILEETMEQDTGITAIAYVIQLSVAPVFLLSGIGAMLAVMTNRLGRIVDYDRVLKERIVQTGDEPSSMVVSELGTLSRRSRLISHSITLCTLTALLVCAVIGMLFLNAVLQFDTSTTVAILFITAMLAFFLGLLTFLREIFLATATIRVGLEQVSIPPPSSPPTRPGLPRRRLHMRRRTLRRLSQGESRLGMTEDVRPHPLTSGAESG
jgi:hypothetical protein